MSTEKTEFTFPEPEGDNTGDIVVALGADGVDVIDDTPTADRNRKPMAEVPSDPTEDELASYSASARKRIQHFTKGYHDERRAKETAARERDEAVRVAQTVVEENRRLQGSLAEGQHTMVAQAKEVVSRDIATARAKLKEAQEAFDVDASVAAQDSLMDAKLRESKINDFRPPPLQQVKNVVQSQQKAPTVDPKAQQWLSQNAWFGENEEMHGFAVGLHNKLVADGVSPSSDTYYEKIDARMREKFPEGFDDGEGVPQVRRQLNVVASANRSTASKKIVLTQTQVNIAKRLGVPLELYARQVAEEMRK
jgi:hypothetical protein